MLVCAHVAFSTCSGSRSCSQETVTPPTFPCPGPIVAQVPRRRRAGAHTDRLGWLVSSVLRFVCPLGFPLLSLGFSSPPVLAFSLFVCLFVCLFLLCLFLFYHFCVGVWGCGRGWVLGLLFSVGLLCALSLSLFLSLSLSLSYSLSISLSSSPSPLLSSLLFFPSPSPRLFLPCSEIVEVSGRMVQF